MNSFNQLLLAILAGQFRIPDFEDEELVGFQNGEPVDRPVSPDILQKIGRLQTLAYKEYQKTALPEHLPEGGVFAMANALMVQEDGTYRIMMIERLIVEIVREAIPTECERFDVRYFVDPDGQLLFAPAEQRRFLDR